MRIARLLWFPVVLAASRIEAQTMAIVGATVIDGNGGAAIPDATIVVTGKRITALGPRASTAVPSGARVVDAKGKFVTPGFIDVNVHVTGQGFMKELFPLALYGVADPIMRFGYALEAAQMGLKFGVTTLRDTMGPLPALLALRDAIARGELIGPRLQVAGDILGWNGGMYCAPGSPPIHRSWCDFFRGYQPVGVELTLMPPDSVRAVVNKYLDLGGDFVKYGETTEGPCCPSFITFSPRVQRAIVEEVHKRGKRVDVHSSNGEGHLLAAEAGVDLITHTDLLDHELPDDVIQVIRDRGVICALFSGWSTGPMGEWFERQNAAPAPDTTFVSETKKQLWPFRQGGPRLPPPSGFYRYGGGVPFGAAVKMWRLNATKLIRAKCTIAVGTDSAPSPMPEISGAGSGISPAIPPYPDPGVGTILAIEGLVELGMSPSDAIVAGTKHGAMAAGGLKDFGTLEVGKFADLVILRADPLADISNIRQVDQVVKEGQLIDPKTLPTKPLYYHR